MNFPLQQPATPNPTIVNKRDEHLNPSEGQELAQRLGVILRKYQDKRVLVLAPPCAGKSTLLQHINSCVDMDIVFDTMPDANKRRFLHHENPFMFIDGDRKTVKYTEIKFIPGDVDSEEHLAATTNEMTSYINENLKIEPGVPVFGTNLIDTDVVIYLNLSEEALEERLKSRNAKTHRLLQKDRVVAIKKLIENDIEHAKKNGITVEVFDIN